MESDMDEDLDEDAFEEGGFEEAQLDFEYEFDAPKFFDFSGEESRLDTRNAEMWFHTASTYPPSPLVLKTIEEENTSSKSKDAERSDPTAAPPSDTDMATDISEIDGDCRGLTFYDHMAQDIHPPKSKHSLKSSLPKGSTLMKPTASHLAKQNGKEGNASRRFLQRSQTSLLKHNQKSLENPVAESQAAKRQKLERGHLPKAFTKQQTSFTHKTSKKAVPCDGNSIHTKLKITIPREPDLETAHRARRMRQYFPHLPKNCTEQQREKSTASMFRARPLNRKILEAPLLPLPKKSALRLPEFHEFHLKTSERAMHHSSAASSASLHSDKSDKMACATKASVTAPSGTTDSTRSNSVDTSKQEECETVHKFKARPLNKKIFSSKGDIGVFRNTKRDVTKPMEFNFLTDKRCHYQPPVELFNKLSLISELQQKTGSQPKLPQTTCLPSKGSKENTVNDFQQQEMKHMMRDKPQRLGGQQVQCCVDGEINEIGSRANTRSLNIR